MEGTESDWAAPRGSLIQTTVRVSSAQSPLAFLISTYLVVFQNFTNRLDIGIVGEDQVDQLRAFPVGKGQVIKGDEGMLQRGGDRQGRGGLPGWQCGDGGGRAGGRWPVANGRGASENWAGGSSSSRGVGRRRHSSKWHRLIDFV